MRLIDAEKIELQYGGLAYISPYDHMGTAMYFAEQIKQQPTVDAEPVRHGRWINNYGGPFICKCSNCGSERLRTDSYFSYCPNCGAKMDL